MNRINWFAVAVFGIVVLVAFVVGASLLGSGWGYGGWGMMGFGPFGWLLMPLMWLVPIGLIVLTVLGVGWLVRSVGGGTSTAWTPAPPRACPSCGRAVQSDWRVCPQCGAALTPA